MNKCYRLVVIECGSLIATFDQTLHYCYCCVLLTEFNGAAVNSLTREVGVGPFGSKCRPSR